MFCFSRDIRTTFGPSITNFRGSHSELLGRGYCLNSFRSISVSPESDRKSVGFLTFSEGVKIENWAKIG